ncbi:type II toxin-antitoxin system RelE/ParE family toxin, partial [Thermococcus sp. MAR1]|uniref:type II toxin-antitoxin system RelE/ParE family toxin n=1 Tax=Thermococcus sp. MAR1 TaxID=1638263 RepID=UPI001439F0C0
MVSLIFTEQAKKDLKGIHAFIAKDSHFNATRFIGQLIDKSSILKSYPEIGHLVFPGKFKHL